VCQDYQQQGGWPDERVEIATLCDPIIKDRGMLYTNSEHCQGICIGNEGTSTVGRCSFVETILGCVSVKSNIPL
jgi:hypothetical protein